MIEKRNGQIYQLATNEILKKFSTKLSGLSEENAQKKLKEVGFNIIKKKADFKWLKLMFSQFNGPMVYILLGAAFLSFLFGEISDGIIILVIVFINATIGFFQEFKAEKILKKIQKIITDKAIIIRNKEKKEINSRFLVPGDIVFISPGDKIPADGYLVEGYDLNINEFIFTGESRARKKHISVLTKNNLTIGEISNMVFMGSEVERGEGIFVVTATGMGTELGKIAYLSQEIQADETPLQKKMRSLSKEVMFIAFFIGILALIVGSFIHASWYKTFLFALALSVSVVPEGLPAALSVALSLGMKRLMKINVLVKKLVAVETLGSVSVICTDKTGTITKNELTVTKIIFPDKTVDVTGSGFTPKGKFFIQGRKINSKESSQLEKILKIGVLCNDADLVKKEGQYKIIGDPTEGALIVASKKYFFKTSRFFAGERKINEIPFSSERRRMSVIFEGEDTCSYVKGSPDILVDLCTHIDINGRIRKITPKDKEKIYQRYNLASREALRMLAFAQKNLNGIKEKNYSKEAEKNLVWVGMMGMIDSPRNKIEKAVSLCRKAGIKLIMITGDYELTAKAIAEKIGLLKDKEDNTKRVINGNALNRLTPSEIVERVKSQDLVFARISPEQKLRITTILKNAGIVVAMTGDGVNDALALKKSDIGIAMGKIGTDVAKEASNMILLDDNLASIVKAVKEGRVIYQNIKKFVHYVFTSNASELLTIVLGTIMQIPAPITAVQILLVDLGTDVFPSLSLGVDPEEPGIINKKPSNLQEKIITIQGFKRLVFLGAIMAISAVITFFWSLKRGGWEWGGPLDLGSPLYIKSTSATYAVIAMTQMANLLQSRSEILSVFKVGFFKNKYAILSIFVSVLMLLAFLYFPLCQKYFHMSPIDWTDWIMVFLSIIAVFFLEEFRKMLARRKIVLKSEERPIVG